MPAQAVTIHSNPGMADLPVTRVRRVFTIPQDDSGNKQKRVRFVTDLFSPHALLHPIATERREWIEVVFDEADDIGEPLSLRDAADATHNFIANLPSDLVDLDLDSDW